MHTYILLTMPMLPRAYITLHGQQGDLLQLKIVLEGTCWNTRQLVVAQIKLPAGKSMDLRVKSFKVS